MRTQCHGDETVKGGKSVHRFYVSNVLVEKALLEIGDVGTVQYRSEL